MKYWTLSLKDILGFSRPPEIHGLHFDALVDVEVSRRSLEGPIEVESLFIGDISVVSLDGETTIKLDQARFKEKHMRTLVALEHELEVRARHQAGLKPMYQWSEHDGDEE